MIKIKLMITLAEYIELNILPKQTFNKKLYKTLTSVELDSYDADAAAFYILHNGLYIDSIIADKLMGEKKTGIHDHLSLMIALYYREYLLYNIDTWSDFEVNFETKYSGRVWLNSKTIAVWWHGKLSYKDLDYIFNHMECIDNRDDWYIELPLKINYNQVIEDFPEFKNIWISSDDNSIIVPINDCKYIFNERYIKISNVSLDQNKKYLDHVLSPILKQKRLKKVYQKFEEIPKGMSQALYNYIKNRNRD